MLFRPIESSPTPTSTCSKSRVSSPSGTTTSRKPTSPSPSSSCPAATSPWSTRTMSRPCKDIIVLHREDGCSVLTDWEADRVSVELGE